MRHKVQEISDRESNYGKLFDRVASMMIYREYLPTKCCLNQSRVKLFVLDKPKPAQYVGYDRATVMGKLRTIQKDVQLGRPGQAGTKTTHFKIAGGDLAM